MSSQPKNEKLIFVEAIEQYAPDQWPSYLDQACDDERIAVFDNDGTLWSEQPIYFQLASALDRVKALAPKHPEWKEKQPFKAVLDGNMKSVLAGGEKTLLTILMAMHTGMTTTEFEQIVKDWIKTERHPRFNRRYDELVYQPMRPPKSSCRSWSTIRRPVLCSRPTSLTRTRTTNATS
jgi:hypothetical protein